jgi:hypothetical protein
MLKQELDFGSLKTQQNKTILKCNIIKIIQPAWILIHFGENIQQ